MGTIFVRMAGPRLVGRRWQVLDDDEQRNEGRAAEDVDRRNSTYRRGVPYLLSGWTVMIWIGRVRNILASDGALAELFVPVVLVALGIATLIRPRRFAPLLAVTTIVVWMVRMPLLVVHDHSAAFVIVHLVLATVSVTLAALTIRRGRQRTRRPATA